MDHAIEESPEQHVGEHLKSNPSVGDQIKNKRLIFEFFEQWMLIAFAVIKYLCLRKIQTFIESDLISDSSCPKKPLVSNCWRLWKYFFQLTPAFHNSSVHNTKYNSNAIQ